MLRAAVCDDQDAELKMLNKLLEHYGKKLRHQTLETELYSSPRALIRRLEEGARFDFFILDMMMPEYNGVDVGRVIRAAGLESAIIYITASPDFALDAISVHPEQYLLKPLDPQALFYALDSACERINRRSAACLSVRTRGGTELLPYPKVVCVEHVDRIMRVYSEDGGILESVYLREPFEKLTEPILGQPGFVRTHKSYLVNLHHIRTLLQGELRMDTGLLVPISRRNAAEVRRTYLQYMQYME